MKYDAIFFDLDDTLYQHNPNMQNAIRDRLYKYIRRTLDIPEEEIAALRERLYYTYGGTLPGLHYEYHTDYYESLRFAHDIPVETYLEPAPRLHDILLTLPQERFIFTNSWRVYANRCLRRLGLTDCFNAVIDCIDTATDTPIKPKPHPEAFRRALQISGHTDPTRCIFVDDQPHNVQAAHDLGFTAVQVGPLAKAPEADYYLASIEDIGSITAFKA